MPISVRSPERGLATPLRALVRVALTSQGARSGEIGVVLTDDVEVRALNRQWRGLDRTTDVLSFGYDDDDRMRARPRGARAVSGDVVISMERAREQARRFRVSEGRELARLVVHGTLHLAGLDH